MKCDPNSSIHSHLDESCQRVDENEFTRGLTKREYFAAKAMEGMLANPNYPTNVRVDAIAEWSAQQADALIAELNK